jgi:Ni,Fe-hydrogenase I large subunit
MSRLITVDMNRVEGDLRLKIELEAGVVKNAWTVGTMFRGFEQILLGRSKMDGLVITPRICGICGTAHLYAAVSALETAMGCPIAPNGARVRNICLMVEELQSDARHAFLMFTIDLCHARYAGLEGYPDIVEAFTPFQGRVYRETIVETKKLLGIIALFGGQWPHSSHMIPGGVAGQGNRRTIVKSLGIIDSYTRWYEKTVLGCSIDRWLSVRSLAELDQWLEEKVEHRSGALGLFIRFGRQAELAKLGRGSGNMLSYGVYFDPVKWQPPFAERTCLRAPGFYNAETQQIEPFSQDGITEHVKHSWFRDYEGGRHPFDGETVPAYETEGDKYSWSKAPRYKDKVVEVGCVPELFMAGDALTQSIFHQLGVNVFTRQLARLHRPALSLLQIRSMLMELEQNFDDSFYEVPSPVESGKGVGLVHAARGALGHWIEFAGGKITKYQVISPTTWNASPRDAKGQPGHWEQSLIGLHIKDESDPIELGHVVRSHDACLVCTVHFLRTGQELSYSI